MKCILINMHSTHYKTLIEDTICRYYMSNHDHSYAKNNKYYYYLYQCCY